MDTSTAVILTVILLVIVGFGIWMFSSNHHQRSNNYVWSVVPGGWGNWGRGGWGRNGWGWGGWNQRGGGGYHGGGVYHGGDDHHGGGSHH